MLDGTVIATADGVATSSGTYTHYASITGLISLGVYSLAVELDGVLISGGSSMPSLTFEHATSNSSNALVSGAGLLGSEAGEVGSFDIVPRDSRGNEVFDSSLLCTVTITGPNGTMYTSTTGDLVSCSPNDACSATASTAEEPCIYTVSYNFTQAGEFIVVVALCTVGTVPCGSVGPYTLEVQPMTVTGRADGLTVDFLDRSSVIIADPYEVHVLLLGSYYMYGKRLLTGGLSIVVYFQEIQGPSNGT